MTLTSYCVTLDLNLGSPAPESFLLPLPSVALERGSLSESTGGQSLGSVLVPDLNLLSFSTGQREKGSMWMPECLKVQWQETGTQV